MKKTFELNSQNLLTKNNLPENIDFESGTLILVNKPLDWTSFDVVNKMKYAIKHNHHLKKIKIGHAGTLDPKADGLLLICTGKFTKMLDQLGIEEKSYRATIKLGVTTASYDSESEEENHKDINHITDADVENTLQSFQGVIEQVPPIFSAVKVNGKNAYTLARRGKDVELKARTIEIKSIEPIDIKLPFVIFDCHVTKGTYIRSLANDIGLKLNSGAYLTALHRSKIGSYKSTDALELDTIIEYIQSFNKEKNTNLV